MGSRCKAIGSLTGAASRAVLRSSTARTLRVFAEDLSVNGGNLLARWKHSSAGGAETSVQAYYDTYRRTDLGTREISDTADLDVQHHFVSLGAHDVVAGGGFRAVRSTVRPSETVSMAQPTRTDPLYSAFLQDEIRLTPELWLTVGSKFEHNSYTGFEYEPSARLAWTPGSRNEVWAAASRAIRQPARVEDGIRVELSSIPLDANTVVDVRLNGNANFRSEELRDFEAGYRAQWTPETLAGRNGVCKFLSQAVDLGNAGAAHDCGAFGGADRAIVAVRQPGKRAGLRG